VDHLKAYIPNEVPEGIMARIEDDLSSNKPSLEIVTNENSIGKYTGQSLIVDEDIEELADLENLNEDSQDNFQDAMITDEKHPYLSKYLQYEGKNFKTFYIHYHPRLKQTAVWANETTADGEATANTIIIGLNNFIKNYKDKLTNKISNDAWERTTTKQNKTNKSSKNKRKKN